MNASDFERFNNGAKNEWTNRRKSRVDQNEKDDVHIRSSARPQFEINRFIISK